MTWKLKAVQCNVQCFTRALPDDYQYHSEIVFHNLTIFLDLPLGVKMSGERG